MERQAMTIKKIIVETKSGEMIDVTQCLEQMIGLEIVSAYVSEIKETP
jgi:hypothetical protein